MNYPEANPEEQQSVGNEKDAVGFFLSVHAPAIPNSETADFYNNKAEEPLKMVCKFSEPFMDPKMGGIGQVAFPNERPRDHPIELAGNPQRFEAAKTNEGYTGNFLAVACVTYRSTLSAEVYRTAKAFIVFKPGQRIDLNGETATVQYAESPENGSYAK